MRVLVACLLTIVFTLGLLSTAAAKPPKGKASSARNEHRSENSLDASNKQKDDGAARGLERAGERQSESAAEHSKAAERQAAKKADGDGGWFDRAGKFLGLGRGDETRSDQGTAREKADGQKSQKGTEAARR